MLVDRWAVIGRVCRIKDLVDHPRHPTSLESKPTIAHQTSACDTVKENQFSWASRHNIIFTWKLEDTRHGISELLRRK